MSRSSVSRRSRSETETVSGGSSPCGDHVLDVARAHGLLLPPGGLHPERGAGLVDHVDRLVGEEAVVHVLGGQLGGRAQRAVRCR